MHKIVLFKMDILTSGIDIRVASLSIRYQTAKEVKFEIVNPFLICLNQRNELSDTNGRMDVRTESSVVIEKLYLKKDTKNQHIILLSYRQT